MEPVICELKYSGAIPLVLAASAAATISLVLMLPWSVALKAFISLGVVALGLRSERRMREVRAVRVEADGTLSVALRDGIVAHGRLQEGCFVAAWLTIVRWRPTGARFDRAIPIIPAMAREQALRRLRVRLRLG